MELSKFIEKFNKIEGNSYTFEEEVTLNNGVYVGYLEHDNVVKESIAIYTGSGLTGTKIKNYFLSSPTLAPWKYQIKIYATDIEKAYITYTTIGDQVEAEDINNLQKEIKRTQQEVNKCALKENVKEADNTTIQIVDDKMVAKSLDGLLASIEELNYLQGLTQNIATLLASIGNANMEVYKASNFATYADLLAFNFTTLTTDTSYIMYVVADEGHEGNGTSYIVDSTTNSTDNLPLYIGLSSATQRIFTVDKIDLTTEVTGKLPQANMDLTNIITKALLDEILANYTPTGGSGTGDMQKSIYDSNNNGIVDYAELAQTIEGALESNPGEVYRHNPLTNKVEFCPLPVGNTKEPIEPIIFNALTKDVATYIELDGEYTSNCVQVSEKLEDETNITVTLESYTNSLVTYKTDNVVCTTNGLSVKDEYILDNTLNDTTGLYETKFNKGEFVELIKLTSEVNE